jgi:hypothetical protein
MPHKDIAYVPPRTNVCPTCGLQHRLVDDEFVHALERLGATPEQIAMIQEESDDLATRMGWRTTRTRPRRTRPRPLRESESTSGTRSGGSGHARRVSSEDCLGPHHAELGHAAHDEAGKGGRAAP